MAENESVTPKNQVESDTQYSATCSSYDVCPVCSGPTFEIRGKLHCSRCHAICETCCEGGRQ